MPPCGCGDASPAHYHHVLALAGLHVLGNSSGGVTPAQTAGQAALALGSPSLGVVLDWWCCQVSGVKFASAHRNGPSMSNDSNTASRGSSCQLRATASYDTLQRDLLNDKPPGKRPNWVPPAHVCPPAGDLLAMHPMDAHLTCFGSGSACDPSTLWHVRTV